MDKKIFYKIYDNVLKDKINIAMYGFANIGKSFFRFLKKDFKINNIYDTNNYGYKFDNIDITRFDKNIYDTNNIMLISAGSYKAYSEISSILKDSGMIENINFFDIKSYIPIYYYKHYNKLVITEAHIALTTRCTLNCKNCNMFIPSHKIKEDLSFSNLQETIDNMFKNIDKVLRLILLGGEPFLHKDIDRIIKYIMDNYCHNIVSIEIVTNGTIIPNNDILSTIKKYNVSIAISDYTCSVNYSEKIKLFEEKLNIYNIEYEIRKSPIWADFLFPYSKFYIDNNNIREHMLNCSPTFKGINDSKFYYCHLVWSAVKAGLIKENNTDYINLNKKLENEEKLKLLQFSLGIMDNDYISLCRLCAGCGDDNINFIKPAVQI